MKVKLTQDIEGRKAGEVLEVDPAEAVQLIHAGVAKRLAATEVTAEDEPPKRGKRDAKE